MNIKPRKIIATAFCCPALQSFRIGFDSVVEEFRGNFKEIDAKFSSIDERFEKIEERLDKVEERLDKIEKRLDKVEKRLDKIEKRLDLLTSAVCDISRRVKYIEENMYTKQDHAKFMVWVDEAMMELRDGRRERILFGRQFVDLDDQVHEHDQRIRVLEAKYGSA